jgi:hypothetical protein
MGGSANLLKNPIVFGILVLLIVSLQITASYLSATSFFEDDIILGLSFFLFVPVLGLILGFYIIWFRKQKQQNLPN